MGIMGQENSVTEHNPEDGGTPIKFVRIKFCYHNSWGKKCEEFIKSMQLTTAQNKIKYYAEADMSKGDKWKITIYNTDEEAKNDKNGLIVYEKGFGVLWYSDE